MGRPLRQLSTTLLLAAALAAPLRAGEGRPNVLLIAIDDLRPELGCYGAEGARTPNIDRLAGQGVVFERAYCMVPSCGASRASLMTSLRPTPKRFVNFESRADADAPGITTLHLLFRQSGYTTLSDGKVLHEREDSAEGWSRPAWLPETSKALHAPENQPTSAERDRSWQSPPYEAADAPDDDYIDAETLRKAVADLGALAAQEEPFFLAVGFYRPHLPFAAPKKYWDLHDPAGIHLPSNHAPPTGAPKEALHPWLELRNFRGIPAEGPVTDETALALIRGYRASVSFVDAQVGRLLDELARLGLADDTIVVLVGDHGWSLGEHGMWSKGSCFETVMRAPLIVRVPGTKSGRASGLVEFIDVYPTLCELSGLPIPAHVQGTSLVPLLKEPTRAGKAAAIGRTRSAETIRTERYRFTEFTNPRGRIVSRMLYDLEKDPGESSNLADQPEHASTVAELQKLLGEGKGKDL